ncbi:MAG: hypothetical protein IMZ52_03040 [Actinobacteria bacterium]|nr:hypothetical protein [Actinomycetota bacterium]MBE3114796.1 hypothetical protein [Actinomycetota bacterium]
MKKCEHCGQDIPDKRISHVIDLEEIAEKFGIKGRIETIEPRLEYGDIIIVERIET